MESNPHLPVVVHYVAIGYHENPVADRLGRRGNRIAKHERGSRVEYGVAVLHAANAEGGDGIEEIGGESAT